LFIATAQRADYRLYFQPEDFSEAFERSELANSSPQARHIFDFHVRNFDMRKSIFAAATAAMLTFGLVSPASALDWEKPTTIPLGSSDEAYDYEFGWNDEKPWKLEETRVTGPDNKVVCDTLNPGINDFMFTVSNGRCHYRTPLEVIKEITNYITSISSVISAVMGIVNNANRFIK